MSILQYIAWKPPRSLSATDLENRVYTFRFSVWKKITSAFIDRADVINKAGAISIVDLSLIEPETLVCAREARHLTYGIHCFLSLSQLAATQRMINAVGKSFISD